MKDFGINLARVLLDYWNVIDMTSYLNGSPNEAAKIGNLSLIPESGYNHYIDQIFENANKYGIQILLDLHGAPGSQSEESLILDVCLNTMVTETSIGILIGTSF